MMISQRIKLAIGLIIAWLTILDMQSQNISVTYLSQEDGLSYDRQYSNSCLLQDDRGFIWIATFDGLNIYDGYELQSFNITTADGLIPRYEIVSLGYDPMGRMWIGTNNEGIFVYDPAKETLEKIELKEHYPLTQLKTAWAFFIDKYDRFLVTTDIQILHFDIEADSISVLYRSEEGNTSMSEFFYLEDGRLAFRSATEVAVENDQGTFDMITNRRAIAYKLQHDNGSVEFSQVDGLRYIWDPTTDDIDTIPPITPAHTRKFVIDSILWTSTEGAIRYSIIDSGSTEMLKLKNREYMTICDMIHTGNSTAYYMSHGYGAGKLKIAKPVYTTHSDKDLWSLVSHNGIIYCAGAQGVFQYVPGAESEWPQIRDEQNVMLMAFTRDDELIINQHSVTKGETTIYDRDGVKLLDKVATPFYEQITQLKDGSIVTSNINEYWTETPLEFVGNLGKQLRPNESKLSRTRFFRERKNGELWVIKKNGELYVLSPRRDSISYPLRALNQNDPIGIQSPHYIFEDSEETIYIAAGNGLFYRRTDESSWAQLDFRLPGEYINVRGMVQDGDAIWIMSRQILLKLDRHTHRSSYYRIPFKYLPEAAVPQDIIIDAKRNIYFLGLDAAVVKVSLSGLEDQEIPQAVILTDLYIDRERISPNDQYGVLDSTIFYQSSFTIPHRYSNVGFAYNCINGNDIDASYYYRLLGFDDQWKNANQDRVIHYTNLDPGDYTFEVKAQSSGGKWTEDITQVNFTVIPPWYRTYWAYAGYLILCLMTAYGYYRYRIYQLMKYQRLRTKISSDLHDDVGSLLSAVAMQSEVLGLDAPPESIAKFDKLSRLSREAMGRMRDTVWAIDARKDNMESLVDRMDDYLSDILDEDTLKLSYSFDKSISNGALRIAPDIRQNVYLIFKEAVNNAVKHSNGDLLQVSLSSTASEINMQIADNGTIDPDQIKSSGLGLSNMTMRADRIDAAFQIDWSNGARISLIVTL